MKWIPDCLEDFLDWNKTKLQNHALCEPIIPPFSEEEEKKKKHERKRTVFGVAGLHRGKKLFCYKGCLGCAISTPDSPSLKPLTLPLNAGSKRPCTVSRSLSCGLFLFGLLYRLGYIHSFSSLGLWLLIDLYLYHLYIYIYLDWTSKCLWSCR